MNLQECCNISNKKNNNNNDNKRDADQFIYGSNKAKEPLEI